MNILAVIVRYNTPLTDSQTITGLKEILQHSPDLSNEMGILVCDNSPEALIDPSLPFAFQYRHLGRNGGVSGAYNQALPVAQEMGARWMLLLDQDTSVTESYLKAMIAHSHQLATQNDIAAIVPVVQVGDLIVSPRQVLLNRHRAYDGPSGVVSGEAFGINSGCLMRVGALHDIGGFSSDFWLDYSDMYVFHQYFLRGLKIFRAADAELQHEMSVMDYDRLMSESRYINFSHAESAFNDLYKGKLENAIQTSRTLVRAVKQRFKYENPAFSRIAWMQFLYRLRTTRGFRIKRWLEEGQRRNGSTGSL